MTMAPASTSSTAGDSRADPRADLQAALAGDPMAVRALVDSLAPVVQARVARSIVRSGTRRRQGRDLRQDVEDFTQEVFAFLFDDGGRALRSWEPTRGLSLANFVGLVAEHQVASLLRSGRRSPWTDEPVADDDLHEAAGVSADADRRVHSREVLLALRERLGAELTPRGAILFQLLLVEERPVDEVCQQTSMNADAVYAWRSRLRKLVLRLAEEINADPASERGVSPRSPTGGAPR
jgi:DNA-directed RNA polymerase specialized sigma24 family protein